MKPRPAPEVPGETEWQRFDNAVRKMFTVPEAAILPERERLKAEWEKKEAKEKTRYGEERSLRGVDWQGMENHHR
jgi:hypothetical protein